MDVALRPELERLVKANVSAGAWASSDELLNEAVERLLANGSVSRPSDPRSEALAQDAPANQEWIDRNRGAFQGQWVALHRGRLVSHGSDGLAVYRSALQAGVDLPLLHMMSGEERAFWGGWTSADDET